MSELHPGDPQHTQEELADLYPHLFVPRTTGTNTSNIHKLQRAD